jgi:hypothetical protein
MNKRELKQTIGDFLKPLGFKKKADSWYLSNAETLVVVNLQKSNFGEQYYINIGCVPISLKNEMGATPKEHQTPIRMRLEAVFPDWKTKIRAILDLEKELEAKETRKEQLTTILRELLALLLQRLSTLPSLRNAYKEGFFRSAAINRDAQDFLAKTGFDVPEAD